MDSKVTCGMDRMLAEVCVRAMVTCAGVNGYWCMWCVCRSDDKGMASHVWNSQLGLVDTSSHVRVDI